MDKKNEEGECLLDGGTKDYREQGIRRFSKQQKHLNQSSPPSRKKATQTVPNGISELLWNGDCGVFHFFHSAGKNYIYIYVYVFTRMINCGRAWLDTHQIHFFFMGIQQPSQERWLRNKPSKEHCLKVKGRRASYPRSFAPAHRFSVECSWVLKQMWQKSGKAITKRLVRKYSEV